MYWKKEGGKKENISSLKTLTDILLKRQPKAHSDVKWYLCDAIFLGYGIACNHKGFVVLG